MVDGTMTEDTQSRQENAETDYLGWKLGDELIGDDPQFSEGFPNPLAKPGQMRIIEDTLILRAHAQGISSVSVSGSSMPVTQAFRSDALLPILTDYLTHTLYRQMNLMFDSELMESLVMDRVDSTEFSGEDFIKEMNSLERDIQRPLLFNESSEDATLGYRTRVSTLATVPASTTLLLMDAAIESAHTLSQNEQLNLHGEPLPDELDLTPVVQSLGAQNVEGRIIIPENLHARVRKLVSKLEQDIQASQDEMSASLEPSETNAQTISPK